jgi:hypothetical protein
MLFCAFERSRGERAPVAAACWAQALLAHG